MRLAFLDDPPSDSKSEIVSDGAFPSLLKNSRLRSVRRIVLVCFSLAELARLERTLSLIFLNMMGREWIIWCDADEEE